jgi:2-isopropylmalate synthase
MEDHIKIFDTTLRDGEQSPGYSMNMDEKMRMDHQLEDLQVDIIEAGFPIASDGDYETVKEISKKIKKPTIAGLCRTRKKDIQRAADALEPTANSRIHIFIASSDIHLKHKLKMSRQELMDSAVNAVEFAIDKCMEVEFSAEDSSRSDPEFLIELFTAVIEAGATTINIPDTVGYALPWEYGELIHTIHDNVPNVDQVELSTHCHNDLGLAVANSLAAIQNGATQIECTINGIGERAGNASLEEIVMCMSTRKNELDKRTQIKTEELFAASQLLTQITGKSVQPNKAIVGENAFAHEAGIHQHGVLNNPMTYEIMTPESVGASGNRIVLGKHSGRFALDKKLRSLGYSLEKKELNQIYTQFTELADKQKIVSESELVNLVAEQPFGESASTA